MSNIYFEEVISAHIEIQRWLTGQSRSSELPLLLSRFLPEFSMVNLTGAKIDYMGLTVFFSDAFGKRPGLCIEIDELEQVSSHVEGAIIRYREHHTFKTKNKTMRRSTVVFKNCSGRVRWLHLHETACVA